MSSDQPLPSPEEIQKKLSEFMKQEFGDRVVFATPQTETVETTPTEEPKRKGIEFNFHLKPKDVKAHLDRFVIQQEDAKKALAIAVCDHYNHVKAAERGEELRDYVKQNVLLIGPTGVGKTYLIKTIADLIGVPFVKADATKFSETGYVGGDVEDLVRELVPEAMLDEAWGLDHASWTILRRSVSRGARPWMRRGSATISYTVWRGSSDS